MTRFVLDCSMTMAWCFEDEAQPRADAVLGLLADGEALVPGLWSLEVANVLAVCERRERITAARMDEFVGMLGSLPIRIDDQTARRALDRTLALARAEQLSAYDAAYLELALREACPLATLDATLSRTAAKLGIVVLPA